MSNLPIPHTSLSTSPLAYGCMQIGGSWDDKPLTAAERRRAIDAVTAAYEGGITLFDHADIYCRGKSEEAFSAMWQAIPGFRDNILLQSKCGIRFGGDPQPHYPPRYDFSYEHIVASVQGSLRRLRTDRLDILLLHRPDPLVQPEEVARAFDQLHTSGKVRYFGVSNHTAGQIALLQKALDQPLIVNQLEFNLLHNHLLDEGIIANQSKPRHALASGILDYCRLNGILVQAWSPVSGGALINPPPSAADNVRAATALVQQMARDRATSPEAILLAWILRHPARIQPIIGTTRPERIRASAQAPAIHLSREEWYNLYVTARGGSLP